MRRLCSAVCCTLVAAFALGGCGTEGERPATPPVAERDAAAAEPAPPANPFAEPARRALRIELGLDGYQTVEGTAAGDPASTFTAHFAGDTLRFIEEHLVPRASGTAVYYFENDALFYAVRDEIRRGPDAAGAATVQTLVAFASDGRVRASRRTVDGTAAPETDVEGLREHAHALRDRARALRQQATAPPA
jgi:hypothetical protein